MTNSVHHRCPQCGGPVQRRRRSLQDRRVAGHHRYRCTDLSCNWGGLLPVWQPPDEPKPAAWSWPALRARAPGRGAAMMLAGGLLSAVATAWFLHKPPPEAVMVGPHVVTRGTHLEGERLPEAHPLKTLLPAQAMEVEPAGYVEEAGAVLRVRRHCAWGLPGRNPYRGSAVQALQTATLSPTVVKKIAADIHAGRRVDRVTIRNDGITARASGREFDPQRVAMTYGMTLCADTRVNFKGNHREEADLYEAMDDDGQIYAVMVPDVCGNVAVLGERYAQPEPLPSVAGVRATSDTPRTASTADEPRPWLLVPPEKRVRRLPPGLRYSEITPTPPDKPGSGADKTVALPGTLALTGLALALAMGVARQRRP